MRRVPDDPKDWGALLQTLKCHGSRIDAVAFSLDGKQLASGSRDGTVKIWNVDSGGTQTSEACSGRIKAVALSPDGKQLVSVSECNTVCISDVETGIVQIFLTPYSILASLISYVGSPEPIAISLNGRSLAYAEQGWIIRVYDIKTKHEQTLKGWPGPVTIMAFSFDGKQLALAWINTISIWDVDSGTVLQTFEGHASEITAIAFSRYGKQLASGMIDGEIAI